MHAPIKLDAPSIDPVEAGHAPATLWQHFARAPMMLKISYIIVALLLLAGRWWSKPFLPGLALGAGLSMPFTTAIFLFCNASPW